MRGRIASGPKFGAKCQLLRACEEGKAEVEAFSREKTQVLRGSQRAVVAKLSVIQLRFHPQMISTLGESSQHLGF